MKSDGQDWFSGRRGKKGSTGAVEPMLKFSVQEARMRPAKPLVFALVSTWIRDLPLR